MAEDEIEQGEGIRPENNDEPSPARRKFFTRRNLVVIAGILGLAVVLTAAILYLSYRTGVFDGYIKGQFVTKMSDMGITFDADVFRVTASPLTLELRNATFTNSATGEKLFFVRDMRLGMTVLDLYSWSTSRDIRVDSSEISGAEVWITFDENGRSNFSGLHLVESEEGAAVNFRFDSLRASLRDSIVHFGDRSRSISGEGRDLSLVFMPAADRTDDGQYRYDFELAASDSDFAYEDRAINDIDIRASGVADDTGAEFRSLVVRTPVGVVSSSGTLRDWASPAYDFDVESTVDIAQVSNIFSPSASIRGIGNLKGHIAGQGETYRFSGNADSQALRAAGVYLRALNVEGTVSGTNANYEANGTAIAEMLTFEDFQIDFPKLVGNVRGTGTDFRWWGELQAIAAKSRSMSLGGLFLSDALAEYKDKEFRLQSGGGRAQRFSVSGNRFEDLRANGMVISTNGDRLEITASNAAAADYDADGYRLQNVTGRNLRVANRSGRTNVSVDNLRSERGTLGDSRLKNVAASRFELTDAGRSTEVKLTDLTAAEVDAAGTRIAGIDAPLATITDNDAQTVVYSDSVKIASVESGSAVLGSLNIAGVRLLIVNGNIRGVSDDIDAGDVKLKPTADMPAGGELAAVRIARPVFIVEPSGKYRATADMSIGGGVIGSVALGSATARVDVNNDRVLLEGLDAGVMEGKLAGNVTIGLNGRTVSRVDASFSDIDLSKFAATQSGRVIPVEGVLTGGIHVTFPSTNYRASTGSVTGRIVAGAGSQDQSRIPVRGDFDLTADNGLFEIESARLNTDQSQLTANGRFDLLNERSEMVVDLSSKDAGEIDRIIRSSGLLTETERQLDEMQVVFAGDLKFTGAIAGNLFEPDLDGDLAVGSVSMRQRELGSLSAAIDFRQAGIEIHDGKLNAPNGGHADFSVSIPSGGANNITVEANLTGIEAGDLLAALPIELPERIRDLSGLASGSVNIEGLPNNANGSIDLVALKGTVAGQEFDNLRAKADFKGTRIDLDTVEIHIGEGSVTAGGYYDRQSTAFDLVLNGNAVPLPLMLAFLPQADSVPVITGSVDINARAVGEYARASSYDIRFDGTAHNVIVGNSPFGEVRLNGTTQDQTLRAELVADLDGRSQIINGTVDFGKETLPFSATTVFNQSPITPYLAFVKQLEGVPITATGTGKIDISGDLRQRDANGDLVFSAMGIAGAAEFTELDMTVQDTPLAAADPIMIRFNSREVTFVNTRLTGGGSNMTIKGVKALADDAVNNLSIDGRISLSLLNLSSSDVFFSGVADVSMRMAGPNSSARLTGTASTENASFATFIGSNRLTLDRVNTNVIFTSNQAEVEAATGYLGGGKFNGSGGVRLNGLSVEAFRFNVSGDNVTVPLPTDFLTTGNARLEITGNRRDPQDDLQITIGGRVYARRSLYTKDIDLTSVVGARREASLSSGPSTLSAPRLDLVIEGRDALIVRNNIADLTASVSLVVTGDANNPRISGRISANSGTLFYRKDRYEVQRGVLEFPPNTMIEPVISLQAETEIGGYQIFVNLSGPLSDTESLNAQLRSSPALPSADVVSLITTGTLSNTSGGIPTLAQSGINTAAEILTDSIINNPARRATDKLFGLNVFEIDPIISSEQAEPGARLTVGRQINNNLRVTYSTNLSQDQKQVLALEYRVSNKLSFIAQYEQRSLSNVTRNRDNFSVEIRFRRRF